MAEPVRLVIWDLDETFWGGTLTEGGIDYLQVHHDLVIALARRGIMNSICSKNDFETVKSILVDKDLWNYFVFPSIDWSPKSPRVAHIVQQSQLRPETILFIDDNHGNREEARALVSGLQIASERVVPTMLDDPLFRGKDDFELTRLAQYKLLEQKAQEQVSFGSDNSAFLRSSDIRVRIEHDVDATIDRAIELINRTNQLNFTKERLPGEVDAARDELRRQLSWFDVRSGLVFVTDKFGDYGCVGFFLQHGHWGTSRLRHFVFSCRVLGMGIEQWVYAKLGRPDVKIVGEVLSNLAGDAPDWINAEQMSQADDKTRTETDRSDDDAAASPPRVLLRGGCELEVLEHFFKMRTDDVRVEVVHMLGRQVIRKNHSALLAQGLVQISEPEKKVLDEIGWSAKEVATQVFALTPEKQLVVYSPTADTESAYFSHRTLALCFPIDSVGYGAMTRRPSDEMNAFFKNRTLADAERKEFFTMIDFIQNEFDIISDVRSSGRFYQKIAECVPETTYFVIVKPNYEKRSHDGQIVRNGHQIALNAQIDLAFAGKSNFGIIDTRSVLKDLSLIIDDNSMNHFHRSVYHDLYKEIASRYAAWARGRP